MKTPEPDFPLIHAVAAVILRGDEFLASMRPAGKPLEGYWEFPGGKINGEESPQDALCRECREELGVTPLDAELLFIKDHVYREQEFRVRLHFFIIRSWVNEPCAREGQTLAWVTPSQALEMKFLPPDMEAARKVERLLHGRASGRR